MKTIHELQTQFSELYEKEIDPVFRFCLIRVSDREQALDIAQEAFTRVWNALQKGTEIGNIRAYIYRAAHNLVVDWYQEKKSVPLPVFTDPDSGEEYESEPLSDGAAVQAELDTEGRFLIAAVGKLNPSYRQAVYLRYIEGLPPPEIGEILGLTANAVSIRLARGLTELRTLTGYDISNKV